jgi:two-component system OmpR family response regulator
MDNARDQSHLGATVSKWVLVVEDDADNRNLVLTVLEDAGYHVTGAATGREALRAIATHRPCLVLADLMMPDMDGRELVIQTRAAHENPPPFVFITGAHPSKTKDISGEILAKPFDFDQLLKVVAHHCADPEPDATLTPPAV